jgi:hypothetical protein
MKTLAARMRDDLAIVVASMERKDARIAALEQAIDRFRQAKDQFQAGAHVLHLHQAEEALFRVMRGEA